LSKNFVIGIGGTGLSAIRELRRLMAERFENGLADREAASTRFLYLDTDGGDVNTKTWNVMGKDISLKPGEIVTVTGDKLKPLVENSSEYPDISPWMPQIKSFIGEPGNGAKGIRPYGRLIYEYAKNKQEIKKKCNDIFDDLNDASNSNEWRFHLVCSLSGGTGSGMALPFSFDFADEWKIFERGTARQKFYAYFVLPPIQVSQRHDRYHPNAYAALKELNYYFFQQKLPYDNCYLLEPQNNRGASIGLDSLPLLIAQRMFLSMQGGAAQARIAGMMDNPNLGESSTDDISGRRHAQCFSSFGVSSISYPREMVAKCFSHRLAVDLAESWLAARDYPKNVNQLVRQELDLVGLSMNHVFGDANPFGTNDFPNHAVEIENTVDERLLGIAKKRLGEQAGRIRQNVETTFRGVGIREFYQQRENDVKGAAAEAVRKTKVQVTAQIRNPKLGLEYAKQFLDELQAVLAEFKENAVGLASEKTQKQIQRFQENLSSTINVVHTNEQKLLYFDGAYQKDRANIGDELKHYLKCVADHSAGKYGVEFLACVIPEVSILRGALDKWENTVRDVIDNLNGKLHTMLESLESGSQENGYVIFDTNVLDGLSNEIIPSVVYREIEEILRDLLSQEQLDLSTLSRQSNVPALLFESAYKWVLRDGRSVDVAQVTLFDKFVTEVPNAQQRQQKLREIRDKAAIFMRVSAAEWGRMSSIPIDVGCVTVPALIGLRSSDGRPTQLVVKSDLVAAGVPTTEILESADLERMVFVQELQGYPLRVIASLEFLAQRYESYSAKEALHIDKRIVSELYELFLPSPEEREAIAKATASKAREKWEEIYVLARSLGLLVVKENQNTKQQEVCFEFEDQHGLPTKYVFGGDWESTRAKLLASPAASDAKQTIARQELERELGLRRKELYSDPQKLRELLVAMAGTCLREYPAGIDDPRYERDQEVVARILSTSSKLMGATTI